MNRIYKSFLILWTFVLTASAQTPGTLTFSCGTTAPSGNWGNKHALAVWIQNSA